MRAPLLVGAVLLASLPGTALAGHGAEHFEAETFCTGGTLLSTQPNLDSPGAGSGKIRENTSGAAVITCNVDVGPNGGTVSMFGRFTSDVRRFGVSVDSPTQTNQILRGTASPTLYQVHNWTSPVLSPGLHTVRFFYVDLIAVDFLQINPAEPAPSPTPTVQPPPPSPTPTVEPPPPSPSPTTPPPEPSPSASETTPAPTDPAASPAAPQFTDAQLHPVYADNLAGFLSKTTLALGLVLVVVGLVATWAWEATRPDSDGHADA